MMRLFVYIFFYTVLLGSVASATTIIGSGGGFSGSGTLTTTSNGDGSSTITAISGTASGVDYLLGVGTFNNNDNRLYPNTASLVDQRGFAFEDTQGTTSYMVDILMDPSSATGYSASLLDSDGDTASVAVVLSLSSTTAAQELGVTQSQTSSYGFSFGPAVASTPEPFSLVLVGTGMLSAFGTLGRRTAERGRHRSCEHATTL